MFRSAFLHNIFHDPHVLRSLVAPFAEGVGRRRMEVAIERLPETLRQDIGLIPDDVEQVRLQRLAENDAAGLAVRAGERARNW